MIEDIDLSRTTTLDADQITERIWCGATLDEDDIPSLKSLGIKRVINLEMYERYPPEALARAGIDLVKIPIRDMDEPLSDKLVEAAVAAIHEFASRGEMVYVHCTAGWQRSPAIVACYLVYTGLAAEQALGMVKQKRRVARFYPAHIASVIRYELRLRDSRSSPRQADE